MRKSFYRYLSLQAETLSLFCALVGTIFNTHTAADAGPLGLMPRSPTPPNLTFELNKKVFN